MDRDKEAMAGCGQHTLAEARTAVDWDGACPMHLEAARDALAEERNQLLDEVEALRFKAESAERNYQTLRAHTQALEDELAIMRQR